MEKKEKITDQELDASLRNVPVPPGLRESLMRIPDRGVDSTDSTDSKAGPTVFAVTSRSAPGISGRLGILAVAATLLMVAFAVFWFKSGDRSEEGNNTASRNETLPDERTRGRESKIGTEFPESKTVPGSALVVEETMDRLEMIEKRLDEMEIRQLEERLSTLQVQSSRPSGDEIASLILSISDQTTVSFGGPKEMVDLDMARIIELYPESRGAAIASEYISIKNENH